MKSNLKKILLFVLSATLLFISAHTVSADSINSANNILSGITEYKLEQSNTNSAQEWINSSLTDKAGSSEWYIIALSQSGNYNFSDYNKALIKYLSDNEVYSASSRQKYTLALIATGSTNEYIYTTLNNSIGEQGVMSWIFGLHLLNNGYKSDKYSVTEVKNKVLSLQLNDGGWAVTGTNGDVDVTAMAVQSLAPYYKKDTKIKNALDKALSFLSSRQQADGDFASYGVNNCESTAQVIIALSSLGIDLTSDGRFIKNNKTLFDGLELYRLKSGGFCHKQGGEVNETATSQAFCAAVAYNRMRAGKASLYILDKADPDALNIPAKNTDVSSSAQKTSSSVKTQTENSSSGKAVSNSYYSQSASSKVQDIASGSEESLAEDIAESTSSVLQSQKDTDENNSEETGGISYKFWVSVLIILLAGIACVALYLTKKANKSNLLVVLAVFLAAIAFVLFTNFETASEHYNSSVNKENVTGTVTLSIRCDTITHKEGENIPADGIILSETELEIEKDDTVCDILTEAATENKLHLDVSDGYVRGINNLYEFQFGEQSGWVYHINGISSSVGCDEYILSDGDVIEWMYTCDLGKDVS